jgi:hypothetical protein
MQKQHRALSALGLVCAAIFSLSPISTSAHHVGESLELDRQVLGASSQFVDALARWEALAPALKAAGLAELTQLAQARQRLLVALVQASPKVAAARMLPKSLRARLPQALEPYIETEVRVQGTGHIGISDNFASGVSRATFKVLGNPGAAPQSLFLADASATERDLHKLAGKKLTFTAMRVGELLVVVDKKEVQAQSLEAAGGTSTASTGGTTAAAAGSSVVQGDQKTLSILINFNDKALTCSAPEVADRVFGASGPTVNGIFKDSSRGMVGFSGTAVGPFTIPYSSTGSCDAYAWATAAETAARAIGVDPSQYSRVNYVTPQNATCGWSGYAEMPGRQSWVQYCGLTGVYAHELGHNLSLHHASNLLGEYGDYSDPMGGTKAVGLNGANRVMAGWQPAGTVVDVTGGGSYTLTSLSNGGGTSNPQVLRLAKPDTAESYYVSYREALANDSALESAYVNTLSVHRATGTLPTRTYLLQTLAAGQTFSDPVNGITLTNQGSGNGLATVGVGLAASQCARAAPTVSVSPASQTAAPGAAVVYAIGVQNNNSAACASATFNLAQALPAGFTGTLSAAKLTLASGANASANWTVASGASSAGGLFGLDASATDAAAPSSTSVGHASYTVHRDSTPPAVAITSPLNGAVLSGTRSQSITVSATDPSGIQAVEVYVDGVLVGRDTSGPYSISWALRKVAKGPHTVMARAIDNAGQKSEQSIAVTLN